MSTFLIVPLRCCIWTVLFFFWLTRDLRGEDIFHSPRLLRLEISIDDEGMQKLRDFQWNPRSGDPKSRPKVRATLVEGTNQFTNVTVHLKGSYGSYRPVDNSPALTLSFDTSGSRPLFHGLNKISLNNSVQDPSCLNEKLARELFETAGIPCASADHAVVILNGRQLGVYVLIEGYSKRFLQRHFGREDGIVMDSGFVRDVDSPIEANVGDEQEGRRVLERAAQAAREPDPAKRLQALERVVDLDRFLSLIALEVMLCHWDGYAMNRNNYRVYIDPVSSKVTFLPHGVDQILGIDRANLDTPLLPRMKGLIARSVLSVPEGRARYLHRLGTLFTNLFQAELLVRRVHEMDGKIANAFSFPAARWVLRSPNSQGVVSSSGDHGLDVEALCQRITKRASFLGAQLLQPGESRDLPPSPTFAADGSVHLSGWRYKPARAATGGRIAKDGQELLRVVVAGTPASWRTRLTLPAGEYRFTGRIRATEESAMICLRISGQTRASSYTSASWMPVAYNFRIEESLFPEDVELVCEALGIGEAWFDPASLMLHRLTPTR